MASGAARIPIMFILKVVGVLGIVSAVVLVNQVTSPERPASQVYSLEQNSPKSSRYREDQLGGIGFNRRNLAADTIKNKNWWNESYRSRILRKNQIQMPSSSYFWKVNKGYGYDPMSLNKVCARAYSMKISDIELYRDWIKTDLESYCTISGQSGSLDFLDRR